MRAMLRPLQRIVSSYDRALQEKPLTTKCISGGVIMGTCELVSQTFTSKPDVVEAAEAAALAPAPPPASEEAPAPLGPLSSLVSPQFLKSDILKEGLEVGKYNVAHAGAFGFLFGTVYLAPHMHNFYLVTASWPVPLRILVNSLIIDPMNYSAAMSINAVAHGEGLAQGFATVETKLLGTIKTGLAVWPAAQVINFYFVPLHWRVLFFNSVSLVWNSWLAWSVEQEMRGGGGDGDGDKGGGGGGGGGRGRGKPDAAAHAKET